MYEPGIFYFHVLAANLVNWTINLDITPASATTTYDSSSNTPDDTPSSTTANENQTSESSTDEDASAVAKPFQNPKRAPQLNVSTKMGPMTHEADNPIKKQLTKRL